MDGMDQNKTDIPHIISNPKALAGSYRLETHITGVQAHGHITLMLIDCGQFPHDSNLTIEALVQVFQHLKVSIQGLSHFRGPVWGSFSLYLLHGSISPIGM